MTQNWGSWTPYTPTIDAQVSGTTDPNLGSTGTSVGWYQQNGVWVIARGKITFGGSGVNAGSGWYCFSLPVPIRDDTDQIVGVGYVVDASADQLARTVVCGTAIAAVTGDYFIAIVDEGAVAGGTNPVGSAVPWTWAAGDQIGFQVEYEAATS